MSENWISARAARELVQPGCTFVGPTTDAIRQHAAAGLVRSKAVVFKLEGHGPKTEYRDYQIPPDFWELPLAKQDWWHGTFCGVKRSLNSEMRCEALGVTFARADIVAVLLEVGTVASTQPATAGQRPAGGRPPKVQWEAVMIELARQLYVGDLAPKTQADLEKAIADYLSGQEIALSESTIREHARPLWRAIQSEAEN